MVGIILTLGYLLIAFYLAILVVPKILRKIIDFFSIGSRLYLVGLFRLILGVLLLTCATEAKLWSYVVTLGLLLSASGVCTFFFALRRTKKILLRLRNQSNLILRLWAMVGLIIWVVASFAFLNPSLILLLR